MTSEYSDKHIVHVITGLNDGGAEAVLHRLISADEFNRHTVISLTNGGKYRVILEGEQIEVYSIGMTRGRPSIRAFFQLSKLIARLSPDLVQTWMYHADLMGGVAARLAGVKHVVWGLHHTTLDKETSSQGTRLVAKTNAWLSRFCPSKIICCARRSKSVHVDLGYDANRMIVVPNGYNMSIFRRAPAMRQAIREEMKLNNDTLCFGTISRFNAQKDHANTIKALSELKKRGLHFVAIFAGTDMTIDNQELMQLVRKADLVSEIRLIGPRNDVPAIMNSLDIHVLGSAYEAFSNVICEAMACGTPCVATDVGDCAFIVGNTGVICPPRDSIALADALESALPLVNSETASLAARRRIEDNFSLDAMVSGYKAVWASLE